MKWVFVILVFMGGDLVNTGVGEADTAEACEDLKAGARVTLKDSQQQQFAFGDCHTVKIPPRYKKERDS